MTRRHSDSRSTLSRIYDIGGADLALRYHEISERARASSAAAEASHPSVPTPAPAAIPRRAFYVNCIRISDEDVGAMERAWNTALVDGRYWYDRANGAWGVEGGPCVGFIEAGLALGGPLMANASSGGTGVYVNGRELHPLDVFALSRMMSVWPGRYWVDSAGNFGWEAGPVQGNLAAAMKMPVTHQGGPWTVSSCDGTVGGDGEGFRFFNNSKTFWST